MFQIALASRATSGHYAPVAEFLIRTTDSHEWPAFRDPFDSVLIPAGSDFRAIEGWGDFRMATGDTVVAFSGEEVGWQVTVEGPMTAERAETLVGIVTEQIGQSYGEPCEWLRLA